MEVKYPNIQVNLVGQDGNSFYIMAKVVRALRKAGKSTEEVDAFIDEFTSGDRDKALQTAMRWVDVK